MAYIPPSIFNDVIGPVMIGPSSSHTAASQRIGKLAAQLLEGELINALIEFDPEGSLASTYQGHGSDIGLAAGFLGIGIDDPQLIHSLKLAEDKGINISFKIRKINASHPNFYRITLTDNNKNQAKISALSTGGGIIEITEINGFSVQIIGDYFETLINVNTNEVEEINNIINELKKFIPNIEEYNFSLAGTKGLINIKTRTRITLSVISGIKDFGNVTVIKQLDPVLTALSAKGIKVPFISSREIIENPKLRNRSLWELAILYESERSGLGEDELFSKMNKILTIMQGSIHAGLKKTFFEDRILGPQAWMIKDAEKKGKIVPAGVLNTIIAWTMAVMEVKSSFGVIVAAPTAGSCGTVPGAILGIAEELSLNENIKIKALLAAGLIGIFIAESATFAAEIGGCQAECGAASGMAAAGIVELMGGTVFQGLNAASIALQNIMGMICDPVANRVEVPCLGKNVLGATNALSSANMALANVDPVIPLDEVIEAMYKSGKMLPSELRCTGFGGLSLTETAKNIKKKLEK